MNQALVGVIGVAAGALATGGVQALMGWRERRTDAIASSRILWAEFRAVVLHLQEMLKEQQWGPLHRHNSLVDAWNEEKRTISRAPSNVEYHHLITGVHHARVVLSYAEAGTSFEESKNTISLTTRYCIEARVTTFIAGEPLHRRLWHYFRQSGPWKPDLYEPDVPKAQAGIPGL